MKKRLTLIAKWDDPWFMGLSKDAKLLFLYMCDKCDGAGFLERVDILIERDTGLSRDSVETLLTECTQSVGRVSKVYRKTFNDGHKEILWIANRVKIQGGTTDLSSKSSFIQGILPIFKKYMNDFPEIEDIYQNLQQSLDRVCRERRGSPHTLHKSKSKSKSNYLGGECERGDSVVQSRTMESSELKGKHELYDKVLDCADLRNAFPYETFVELRHKWPDTDVDWPALIEWVTQAHISAEPGNGIGNAYKVISSMLSRNKFRKQVKAGHKATPELEQHARERGRLNRLYEDGKLTADEVRKAHAENNRKYGVKA